MPVDRVGDEREHLLFGRQVVCCGCRWIVCESDRCYETADDECARVDCCCRDILTSCRIALRFDPTLLARLFATSLSLTPFPTWNAVCPSFPD